MKNKELIDRINDLEKRIQNLERFKTNLPKDIVPWVKPFPNRPWTQMLICPHCGEDSGWPLILHMVIPPEGLSCKNCGQVCIYGNTITCLTDNQTHPQYHIETKPIQKNTVVCEAVRDEDLGLFGG